MSTPTSESQQPVDERGTQVCGCGKCDTTGTCPDCGGDGQVVDITDVDVTPGESS